MEVFEMTGFADILVIEQKATEYQTAPLKA
jgi:hypothetical protein